MPELIEGYRLSPQQKRLWQLQREGLPSRSWYALLLEGSLKPKVLQKALQVIVNRHEILRTTFRRSPGIPLPIQVIETIRRLDWRIFDWNEIGDHEQKARLARLFDEAERSFPGKEQDDST